ncbi:MAG: hypothetical protein Q4A00_04365 [Flavobacteriaceae bacterium]|nr:hypothetical protein [Flavobacteriaceae bacterium]
MNFLRNTFAVFIGLFVAIIIITIGLKINSDWGADLMPFAQWHKLLKENQNNAWFFITLLISSGIASSIGGITTAILVKYAKVAYSMLIGFILLFLAVLDIIIFSPHPTFYQIGIFLTFFPFSWVGGKIIEVFFDSKNKKE